MKKILVALTAACIAFSCFGTVAFADGENETAAEKKQVESLVGMYYMQGESGYGYMADENTTYSDEVDYTAADAIAKAITGTNRVPFYATEKDGGVFFDRFAQATFISEINYAAKAGVDFVAYKYHAGYKTDASGSKVSLTYMNNQLKLHSTLGTQANAFIKEMPYAVVLDGEVETGDSDTIVKGYLICAGYLTASDGRPVVFIEWNDNIAKIIQTFNKKLKKLVADGANPKKTTVPKTQLNDDVEAMYVVALNAPSYAEAVAAGCDAVSWLGGEGKGGEAYTQMTARVEANWKNGDKVVPNVVVGYDKTDLADNPIEIKAKKNTRAKEQTVRYSANGTKEDYVAAATPEEFTAHLTNAVATANKPAEFSAVMVYAWDDLTGGAILCPTQTDKANQYEYSYLTAMRKYLYGNDNFNLDEKTGLELVKYDNSGNIIKTDNNGTVTVEKNGEIISKTDKDGNDLLAVTPAPTGDNKGTTDTASSPNWVLIGCIAGGVVVVAVVAIIIAVSAKKKKPADKAE